MNNLRSHLWYRLLGKHVLCPLWLLGFRAVAKARGFDRLRIGTLSVWGDAGFLALAKSSMERLKSLDLGLHGVLTQGQWAWIFQAPKDFYTGNLGPPWLFSVELPYLAWQSDGLIARLIYIAFCMSEFAGGHKPGESVGRHKGVIKRSRSWLESRGFPEALIDCYPRDSADQPNAPPNGGPAMAPDDSSVSGGPPSVS